MTHPIEAMIREKGDICPFISNKCTGLGQGDCPAFIVGGEKE